MDSVKLNPKEMFGLQNETSETIADKITDELSNFFGEKIDYFSFLEMMDEPYITFSINFTMYKYFNVVLNYDRGLFGCSIMAGNIYIHLDNSQKWYDKADMNVFLQELQQQIELRIPDKFLEHYGWK